MLIPTKCLIKCLSEVPDSRLLQEELLSFLIYKYIKQIRKKIVILRQAARVIMVLENT